jgi:hypothetical protein
MNELKKYLEGLLSKSEDRKSISLQGVYMKTIEEKKLSAISKRNFSLGELLKIVKEGGAMLQTEKKLPPNFEYLGEEKARNLFKKFGVLYDTTKQRAIFFIGDCRYCELTRAELNEPANADYVKNFVHELNAIQKI